MSGEWQFTDFYDYDFDFPDSKLKETQLKQYTDITVLLDRSGSMQSIKESMETAFNDFIKEHKKVSTSRITLIQFDSKNNHEVVYQNVPIESAERLTLYPRGDTPLIDAFVRAIDSTGDRLANMREADRPDQVLMVIITDGQENASRTYKRQDVRDRVAKQHDTYKWQFVYLGANQDAIQEAHSYGIGQQWALGYLSTAGSTRSMADSLTANTMQYTNSSGGARGQSVQSFTGLQRKKAMEPDDTDEKNKLSQTEKK